MMREIKYKNEIKVSAINDLRAENEKLRKALNFYADIENWQLTSQGEPDCLEGGYTLPAWEPSAIEFDNGAIARQALEGVTNE